MSITHRYTLTWWFLFLGFGALCEIVAVGTAIKNFANALTGNMNLLEYTALALIVPGMFLFGLVAFLLPFSTKIIISPQGMQYHTLAATLSANWQDLVNLGDIRYGYMGVSTIFIAENPEIVIRNWARHLPWNVADGIVRQGIPVSHFGGFRGQHLQSDIRRFAPHLIAH